VPVGESPPETVAVSEIVSAPTTAALSRFGFEATVAIVGLAFLTIEGLALVAAGAGDAVVVVVTGVGGDPEVGAGARGLVQVELASPFSSVTPGVRVDERRLVADRGPGGRPCRRRSRPCRSVSRRPRRFAVSEIVSAPTTAALSRFGFEATVAIVGLAFLTIEVSPSSPQEAGDAVLLSSPE